MSIIQADRLVREFRVGGRLRGGVRQVRAVDEISFTVAPGESVGYIGANGAGKSTTIKMLSGILTPTSGQVRTCGLDPVRQRRELAAHLGVVFGQRSQLWWDLPLAESLTILAAVHRLPTRRWTTRRDELVDRLDLGAFLQRPVRQLSLGERMRGELAAALLHEPELLILDEPTVGLDVLSKERLRVFLREENAAIGASGHGRTMLLTTHDMDDVERLCERLLVVDRGRLVYDGDQAGLTMRVGARRVLVVDLAEPHASLAQAVSGLVGVQVLAAEGGGLRHRFAFAPGTVTAAEVLSRLSAHASVRDLSIVEPEIEDVVRRLYEATSDPR
ncbi:MAG: ATP-binding cassette domain-containing protein [Kineosporiaceae bacterium]|nr:ATP-binding cassette domain-containing protein [Kineosporiaceae bacterium]MBK8075692.1 ATP-binding cassette domain-containing protein [Kineosporiaceae bacterium]